MASEQDIAAIVDTLIAEGYAEGPEGMRLIAETILNRAEQRGISPAEVVRQRAQYTGYENPGPAAQQAQPLPAARSAAQAAWLQAQGPDDPTGGANHYFNPNVVTPSWASAMTPTGQYGNHAFYTDRPVAAPPRVPPAPAMLSPTGAAIRQMTSPSGGNSDLQTALDRVATRERNRVTPAPAEDRVTARNRSVWLTPADPFNGDPMTPASGSVVASFPTMPQPPTTRPVATTTVRPSASDLVRGNPMQTREVATTIASIPTTTRPPTISASDMARGRSLPRPMTVEQMYAGIYPTKPGQYLIGSTDGLGPAVNPEQAEISTALLTGQVNPQGLQVTKPMTTGPYPFPRPASFAPTQVAQGKVAPTPFNRPTAVGTQLSTTPMPPMPIARPGIGGPFRIAPVPMPASMRPAPQRSAPPTIYYTNPMAFGSSAVSLSGDTSVGSQADAAAARSSGEGGRNRRY